MPASQVVPRGKLQYRYLARLLVTPQTSHGIELNLTYISKFRGMIRLSVALTNITAPEALGP